VIISEYCRPNAGGRHHLIEADGRPLTREEIGFFVDGVTAGTLPD